MKILIKVTKEVLERSKFCKPYDKSTSTNCAISLAVRELFPNASVERLRANLLGTVLPTDKDVVLLPNKAVKFIQCFDDSSPSQRIAMEPISFEINVSDFVIQQIGLRQIYKVLSESKTLEHVNTTL